MRIYEIVPYSIMKYHKNIIRVALPILHVNNEGRRLKLNHIENGNGKIPNLKTDNYVCNFFDLEGI